MLCEVNIAPHKSRFFTLAIPNKCSYNKVLKDAIKFAKGLEDQKTSSICYCNLGVIEG